MKTILVTGSSGLIGSEVFFGPQGDTRWNQQRLQQGLEGFVHHELDIRDRAGKSG